MRVGNIHDMKNGWFVGNFSPTVFKTEDVEISHQKHKKGETGKEHFHTDSVEINYILKGELMASGTLLSNGDIFIYGKNEISKVIFLENTDLIIVRLPSSPEDKVFVEKEDEK
jgi:quercetin dioxygenase-like cupin family protein